MNDLKISSIPLGLYIHIPWCVKKCPYCDFNSHTLQNDLPEEAYIDRLIKDLVADVKLIDERPVSSIFFGGGTPSLFSPEILSKLLAAIAEIVWLTPNLEITLEANPGTVDQARFQGFREAGINRLSIGVQSFNSTHLKSLGRIHDSGAAINAAIAAKKSGYTNFNLDLMFGLPDQSIENAITDLKTAIDLNPPHISWYQLTIEPNTLFHYSKPVLPDDDRIADMQQQGQQLLKENNYHHYEISAYGKSGHECQHNLNYWLFGDYLGIGAGAHSKITDLNTQTITRLWKTKNPKNYLNDENIVGGETIVNPAELPFEFMLNALRLQQAIPFKLYTDRTGLPTTTIEPILQEAAKKGLIHLTEETFQPTSQGYQFLNDLTAMFLVGREA